MAVIPLTTGPSVQGRAGDIGMPGLPEQRAGVRGTAAGQGGYMAQALQSFGQDVSKAGQIAGQEVLQQAALDNEAMARDADATAATGMANIYNEFSVLEGEKAVGAKDAYMAKMNQAREDALATMPNPNARRMLDQTLTRRLGMYQEGIGRYAATEQKRWQVRAAQSSTVVAANQASVFRNDPANLAAVIEGGVGGVLAQAELHGWDEATTQTQIAAFRGGTYNTVIHQLLADGRTDEAVSLYEANRDKMDATNAARIGQALKPAVQKAQDQRTLAATAPPGVGGKGSADERAAVLTQKFIDLGYSPAAAIGLAANAVAESGVRENPGLGDGGKSSGLFQWNAERRQAFRSRYGVDPHDATMDQQVEFAHWELQNTEGNAGDAIRNAKTPEEAAATASRMFLRPGDTEGEARKRAGIATRLAQARGESRQPPTYERPDFEAWRERVRAEAGGDFEREARLVSQVNQRQSQWESSTAVARTDMKARLTDVSAALADGRAVAIPEQEIRALWPAAAADEEIGRLNEVRQAGIATASVRLASPAEFQALLEQYGDVGKAPDNPDAQVQAGYAQRQKIRTSLITARERSQEQLKKDPALYVAQSPVVAALATQEAMSQPGGPEAYARASLAEQERMGLPEPDRRVLTKDQAAGLVHKIVTADPEKTPIYAVLDQMQKDYGAMMPAVWRDMVRTGLPKDYAVLGTMTAPGQVGVRGDVQKMLSLAAQKGGMAQLHKAVQEIGTSTSKPAKEVDEGLGDALADFQQTTRFGGGPELYGAVADTVKNLAYYYVFQGARPADALKQATSGVLGMRYDFDGTMRAPKGQMPLVREATQGFQRRLTADMLAPVTAGPLADSESARLLKTAQNGFWAPSPNDDGLVLWGSYENIGAGVPIRLPIKGRDGQNITLRFADMDAMRSAYRAGDATTLDPNQAQLAAERDARLRR